MANDELIDKMKNELNEAISAAKTKGINALEVEDGLRMTCEDLVRNGRETARLVALTNIAGTAADPTVETDILQAQAGGVDFRSLYKRSTRPILMALAVEAKVKWTPSADPYVSNPYRELKVDDAWVERRNNKLAGAENLNFLLGLVKAEPDLAKQVLTCLAWYELERLQSQKIEYRIPPRLTVPVVASALKAWLDGGAGGKRLETASVALLRHVGGKLNGMWTEVTSHHVNDPVPYDALCKHKSSVHTVVEVKDQKVTLQHLHNLADQMLDHGAQRGLLLTRHQWLPQGTELTEIDEFLKDRSVLGLRIQILDTDRSLLSWLPLIDADDESLPDFIRSLTSELDVHGELADRTALATILSKV